MNILLHNSTFYVTDKETFPTKPYPQQGDGDAQYAGSRDDEYREAVADFIRDCTPIISEDQDKIKNLIFVKIWGHDWNKEIYPDWQPLDHTIYRVEGLQFEEFYQLKTISGNWVETYGGVIPECEREDPMLEYRRAFRVVETKEE